MAYRINLRQMRYFIAVAQALNFRRAAEHLHITQPPLSRQIRLLEEGLGTRLFERDRQGVRLTAAGTRLLADASALVQASEEVSQRAGQRGSDDKPLRIRLGITTVIDVGLFFWVEAALQAHCPKVTVHVQRQISVHSIRDLHQGTIDLAVVGLPARTQGLAVVPLCTEPLVACIASNHPCARKRQVALRDLAQDRLFWFARKLNPVWYDHCQQVFARLGFFPCRTPEPDDHHVLLGLVAAGQGIALVPTSLRAVTRKGVVFKKLAEGDALCIRLAAVYREDTATEQTQALLALLRARFSGQKT